MRPASRLCPVKLSSRKVEAAPLASEGAAAVSRNPKSPVANKQAGGPHHNAGANLQPSPDCGAGLRLGSIGPLANPDEAPTVPPDDNVVAWPDGRRRRLHPHGADEVEFLLSPNRGEELRPLRRVASGGELSRIMLALKVVMRRLAQVPTLVFDEIDTGISGRTGTRIGEKMAALGEDCQVVCITHLPQIAARASAHFVVRKGVARGRTLTRVERLDAEGDRAVEIARLLGGQADSAIALRHARELLAEGH